MDQVDIADQVITDYLEKAIAAARGIQSQAVKAKQTAKKCIMCNDVIPDMRRKLIPGCRRCVSCEEDYERYGNKNRNAWIQQDPLDEMIDDIYLEVP